MIRALNSLTFFKYQMTVKKKILLILAGTCLLLLLAPIGVMLLLRLSGVQNFAVHTVIAMVNKRIQGKIALERIGIALPRSIDLKGLLVTGASNDTILAASNVRIRMDLFGLIAGKAHIRSLRLSGCRAAVRRKPGDMAFNVEKLFATGKTPGPGVRKKRPGGKEISLDVKKVRLSDVGFLFDDAVSGVQVETRVGQLSLSLNRFVLKKLLIGVNDVELDSSYCAVRLFKKNPPGKSVPSAQLPHITVKSVKVRDAHFFLEDTVAKSTIDVRAGSVAVTKGDVAVNASTVSAGTVVVRSAAVALALKASPAPPKIGPPRPRAPDHPWKTAAGSIDLGGSRFDLDMTNLPRRGSGFDPVHMHLRDIAVQAKDAWYSVRVVRGKVSRTEVRDSSSVSLKKFAVDFLMDEKGMTAKNLIAATAGSDIRATVTTGYSPFAIKPGAIARLQVNAAIQSSTISTDEVRAFFPSFADVPPFKGDDKKIRLSGRISGTIDALRADGLRAACGPSTKLKTDARVNGLPDVKNIAFDIPALTLVTGSRDVESIMGPGWLPRGLSFPSQAQVSASFKGSLRAFQSTFQATVDNGAISGQAALDTTGRYTGALSVSNLNPGQYFREATALGAATFSATIDGRGFDSKTLSASVSVDAPSVRIQNYTCRRFKAEVRIDSQRCEGTASMNDENLSFDLKGSVQAAKGREEARGVLNLYRADCAPLRLLKDSVRASGRFEVDLTGRDLKTLSGGVNATGIALFHQGVVDSLSSLQCSIATSPGNQTIAIHSAALEASYTGTMPFVQTIAGLGQRVAGCLPVRRKSPDPASPPGLRNFSLKVTSFDHPLVSSGILPGLSACENGEVGISYSEEDRKLAINAGLQYGEYNGVACSGLWATVDVRDDVLSYAVSASRIGNRQAAVDNVKAWGSTRSDRAAGTVSITGKGRDTLLYASCSAKPTDSGVRLVLDPDRFCLAGYPWKINRGNYMAIKDKGMVIHDFTLSNKISRITVASTAAPDTSGLTIGIRDFSLDFLSQLLPGNAAIFDGTLNADIAMRGEGKRSALDASMTLSDLVVRNIKIGSVSLRAHNPEQGKFLIAAKVFGQGNDATVQGSVTTSVSTPVTAGGTAPELDLSVKINSLTTQSIEPFTAGFFTKSRGYLAGSLTCTGRPPRPLVNGTIFFHDVSLKPAALNSTIRLGNDSVGVRNTGLYLNDFSLFDQQGHRATMSGTVIPDSSGRFGFDVEAEASDFLLLNTTERNNPMMYGRLIADWNATIQGTQELPVIDSRVAIKAPSYLTYAIPENRSKTDRGETVVVFTPVVQAAAPARHPAPARKTTVSVRGIELTSVIETDRGVTLRIIPDPSMRDSLVVRGDAALNFGLDKSGKVSLTGTYDLSDGSYTVTLPPLLSKKFTITPGSAIMWNGNPTDATASIAARYVVNAAPIDLIEAQIAGMNESVRSSYRKPLQFVTVLNLSGPVLKPDISFNLDLAQSDKGAFGGMIDDRLTQINQDPTSLNKQVFALLVLGKFIPENTLNQSSGNDQLVTAARSSVSGFLSAQINEWGASMLPGFQFNVGVQSYSDSLSGQAVGKTQVDLGVRKQLFNDRLSVEVGGAIDVQGQRADSGAAKDLIGNVAIEYSLTDDGRYRLKGFRHTQYDALEGQITETGAGVAFSRNFNFWRQLFMRPRKEATAK
jgi:translocation and assembly module TamB